MGNRKRIRRRKSTVKEKIAAYLKRLSTPDIKKPARDLSAEIAFLEQVIQLPLHSVSVTESVLCLCFEKVALRIWTPSQVLEIVITNESGTDVQGTVFSSDLYFTYEFRPPLIERIHKLADRYRKTVLETFTQQLRNEEDGLDVLSSIVD